MAVVVGAASVVGAAAVVLGAASVADAGAAEVVGAADSLAGATEVVGAADDAAADDGVSVPEAAVGDSAAGVGGVSTASIM